MGSGKNAASPSAPSRLEQTVVQLRALAQAQQSGDRRLPPEVVLSRQLGVGRSTLREALVLLKAEGLITRQRRLGTKVTWGSSALQYPTNVILALSDFFRESGFDYQVREISVRREHPNKDVAAALGCPPGGEIFNATRVYAIAGMPAVYVQHYLPTKVNDRDIQIELFQDAIITFLEQIEHIPLHDAKSTITAEGATAELAERLGVETGTPLVVMYTTLFTQDIQAVALGQLVFRPDVVSLSVTAHGRLRLI